MLLLLHGQELFTFLRGDRSKLLLEIVQEFEHPLGVLDHLDLRDVVCPGGVTEDGSNLATEFEDLVKNGNVYLEARFEGFEGTLTGIGILGEFELGGSLG